MSVLSLFRGKWFNDDTVNDDDDVLEPIGEDYDGETETAPATGEMGFGNGAVELKVVKPERYGNVKQIADHLLKKRTIVLNLESTNKETAKRLLDFLSGVAYSIDGQLKRVATNTFVITPSNVDVSGEQMRTAAGEDTNNYTTTFGVSADNGQADNNSDSLY